ncbi:hypothetical protein H9L19_04820 [Weissella diestrammenae]|uniref:Uncharacterized protein n=2 Tax=Weissella diestrammenae TaxID=1162633 RepID=A0A7G9T3S1_9LACO|nr:hypothetical protein [Weissella diestrammenae]QNN74746.1 hypothetical protein H9L19_04820 [Weissella diestrammenae]
MVIALLGVATGTSVAVAQHSHATHVAKQTHKTHKVTKKFAKKESSSSSSSSESSISSEVQSSVVASSATVQPKTQASAAAAPATQQTVASGTQLVTPNVYVYGAPGLCLGYVDSAFGVAGRGGSLSYSARSAVDKASAIGAMHNDANFPAGKMVPVFWNLTGNDDGVNYGHIAIWDGNGGFYWEGNHTSTPNHLSYAEVQAVLNGQMELNGAHITDTFHGASLIGWSDNLEGVQILSK